MQNEVKFVLGLMVLGLMPMVLTMPSLAATVLTAPLLLLVPAGLGNALAFGARGALSARLSRLQSLLIAYFTGTLVIILVFLVSERLNEAPPGFLSLATPIYLLSAVGWLRLGEDYRLEQQTRQRLMIVCALALPLVALRYAYSISIYSEYPVTDLFQRSHFHAGAFEFTHAVTLNPFATDSYIPFQQLFLGMLMRLTGADPLDAEWVWPVAMAPLQIAALLCLIERLVPNRHTALVALAIALAQFALSNPTNSSMAEMAVIVLLSVLLPRRDRMISGAAGGVELLAVVPALLIGLAVTRLPVGPASLLVLALVLAGNLMRPALIAQIWPVAMLATVALTFHRGALLYVGLAVGIFCGLSMLCILRRRRPDAVSRWVGLATVGVLILLAAMCLKILVISPGESDVFGLWDLFDLVLTPVTGKSLANVAFDGDLAPGAGARIAIFEMARAISPLAVLLMLFGVFVLLRQSAWQRSSGPKALAEARAIHLLADIILLFFGLMVLILSGFPFIHRAGFFATLLASVALAIIITNGSIVPKHDRRLSLPILAYMLALMGLAFFIAEEPVEAYMVRALPVLFVTGCVALVVVGLAAALGRTRRLPLLLAVIATVAMEFAVSRSYFKSYAFHNQPPPANGPLAAYDQTDLETARHILALSRGGEILVSDPKTITIMRSRTGLYPLVASSNLDTLSVSARSQLMTVLNGVLSPVPRIETCRQLMQVAGSQASGIYNYGSSRLLRPEASGVTILTALGYNNRLVPTYDPSIAAAQRKEAAALSDLPLDPHGKPKDIIPRQFILLINKATVAWLANPERLNYFPVGGALPTDLLSMLAHKYPEGRLRGRSFMVRLECQ